MRKLSFLFRHLLAGGVLLSSIAMSQPALADHSVGAGFFGPTPDRSSLGIIATTGLSLPIVPIAPQLAIAIPLSGNRYAVTGEARIQLRSTTLGVGAGIARLNSKGSAGTIYDVFIGRQIAPLTTIEARYYGLGSDRAGSTGYLGVRFNLF